jgi:hypothetical protein
VYIAGLRCGVNWRDSCEVILFRCVVKWVALKFLMLKVPYTLTVTLYWEYPMWSELAWFMWSDFVLRWSEVKWSDVKWSYVEVLGDTNTMYIILNLYCTYINLIVLWLFHLGVLVFCTVVVLTCFIRCGCVCVAVLVICARTLFPVLRNVCSVNFYCFV